MSMPKFPELPDLDIESSVAQILSSIAMEELALSHIINAEGEKIQYILGTLEGSSPSENPTIDQVLEINESVKDMLNTISMNQMFLMGKMSTVLNANKEYEKNKDKDKKEKEKSFGSYLSMISGQTLDYKDPLVFDKTITQKNILMNDDHSFTLLPSKYWKIDFGMTGYSPTGISEILFYINDELVTNMPIPGSSSTDNHSISFITPAPAGAVLKVLSASSTKLGIHEENAYLTIEGIADY